MIGPYISFPGTQGGHLTQCIIGDFPSLFTLVFSSGVESIGPLCVSMCVLQAYRRDIRIYSIYINYTVSGGLIKQIGGQAIWTIKASSSQFDPVFQSPQSSVCSSYLLGGHTNKEQIATDLLPEAISAGRSVCFSSPIWQWSWCSGLPDSTHTLTSLVEPCGSPAGDLFGINPASLTQ